MLQQYELALSQNLNENTSDGKKYDRPNWWLIFEKIYSMYKR